MGDEPCLWSESFVKQVCYDSVIFFAPVAADGGMGLGGNAALSGFAQTAIEAKDELDLVVVCDLLKSIATRPRIVKVRNKGEGRRLVHVLAGETNQFVGDGAGFIEEGRDLSSVVSGRLSHEEIRG